MRPVPKRAFAFRYIESLGPKNHGCLVDKPFENVRLPDRKNRLSRATGTSNFRGLINNTFILSSPETDDFITGSVS